MERKERIAIVGSGLVGSLLAVSLARRGYLVDVYERHGDLRRLHGESGRSINLTLCERGLVVLDALGVGERVRGLAVPAYGRIMHATDGSTTFQPYGSRREAIHSISRNELNKCLLCFAEAEPGVTLRFEEKCEGVDLEKPSVTLKNAAGEEREVEADHVIGTDGAYSAVRLAMQKTDRFDFDYSQYYVPQGYKELRLPAKADGGFALEPEALHIWPRGERMLIGFANTDGSFTIALHLPFEGEASYASIKTEDDLLALFRELFPDALPLMPGLVESFFERPAMSMVTVRAWPWTHGGKVALVGDAAHAIVPSYGQGANCGFEDVAVFVACLDEHGGDWQAALPDYAKRRKPHADAIAQLALDHFDELQSHVADPGFLLLKEAERRVEELCPGVYPALYSLVSFTLMPYAEARDVAAERRSRLDRVLATDDASEKLRRGELDAALRDAFAGVAPDVPV